MFANIHGVNISNQLAKILKIEQLVLTSPYKSASAPPAMSPCLLNDKLLNIA